MLYHWAIYPLRCKQQWNTKNPENQRFIQEETACTREGAKGASWHYWGAASAGRQPLSPHELTACRSWAGLGLSHCYVLLLEWKQTCDSRGSGGRDELSGAPAWQEGRRHRHGMQSDKHMCSYSMPHGQATLSSVIPIYVPESHYLAGDQTPCVLGLGNNETWSQDKMGSWPGEALMYFSPDPHPCSTVVNVIRHQEDLANWSLVEEIKPHLLCLESHRHSLWLLTGTNVCSRLKNNRKQSFSSTQQAVALTMLTIIGRSHLEKALCALTHTIQRLFIKQSPSGYNSVKTKNRLCFQGVVNGTRLQLDLNTFSVLLLVSKPRAVGQNCCDLGRVTERAGF